MAMTNLEYSNMARKDTISGIDIRLWGVLKLKIRQILSNF